MKRRARRARGAIVLGVLWARAWAPSGVLIGLESSRATLTCPVRAS